MSRRRPEHLPALRRVGHKGADLVTPGNTIESFEAALRAGVDMIEFDVLRMRDGRLVLAHDPAAARREGVLTLEQGLDHFAGEAYAGVELNVDLKIPGYEREVVEALAERGLVERALVSTQYIESLDAIGALGSGVRRGLSVPKVRRDYRRTALAPLAYGVVRVWRARLPGQAAALLRARRIEAVMAHDVLVSRRLVERVRAEGGELYVWTVDDPERIGVLSAWGVDGVITNDPRLFAAVLGDPA